MGVRRGERRDRDLETQCYCDRRNSQVEGRISHLQDLVREGVRGRASQGFKSARILMCKLRPVSVQSIRKVN